MEILVGDLICHNILGHISLGHGYECSLGMSYIACFFAVAWIIFLDEQILKCGQVRDSLYNSFKKIVLILINVLLWMLKNLLPTLYFWELTVA